MREENKMTQTKKLNKFEKSFIRFCSKWMVSDQVYEVQADFSKYSAIVRTKTHPFYNEEMFYIDFYKDLEKIAHYEHCYNTNKSKVVII